MAGESEPPLRSLEWALRLDEQSARKACPNGSARWKARRRRQWRRGRPVHRRQPCARVDTVDPFANDYEDSTGLQFEANAARGESGWRLRVSSPRVGGGGGCHFTCIAWRKNGNRSRPRLQAERAAKSAGSGTFGGERQRAEDEVRTPPPRRPGRSCRSRTTRTGRRTVASGPAPVAEQRQSPVPVLRERLGRDRDERPGPPRTRWTSSAWRLVEFQRRPERRRLPHARRSARPVPPGRARIPARGHGWRRPNFIAGVPAVPPHARRAAVQEKVASGSGIRSRFAPGLEAPGYLLQVGIL